MLFLLAASVAGEDCSDGRVCHEEETFMDPCVIHHCTLCEYDDPSCPTDIAPPRDDCPISVCTPAPTPKPQYKFKWIKWAILGVCIVLLLVLVMWLIAKYWRDMRSRIMGSWSPLRNEENETTSGSWQQLRRTFRGSLRQRRESNQAEAGQTWSVTLTLRKWATTIRGFFANSSANESSQAERGDEPFRWDAPFHSINIPRSQTPPGDRSGVVWQDISLHGTPSSSLPSQLNATHPDELHDMRQKWLTEGLSKFCNER